MGINCQAIPNNWLWGSHLVAELMLDIDRWWMDSNIEVLQFRHYPGVVPMLRPQIC